MLTPFAFPFYVMAKPVGSSCNLHCRYCYFLDKATGRIDDRLLETFISQYIEAQTTEAVLFTWHGGEPLLMPQSFYELALKLQRRYARGHHIDNCLQTNGTLLTDEWCQFFHDNNFLIGISIDGPQPLHDHYRQQHEKTMHGVALLKKYDVMWNALATVNRNNADFPDEFYDFFKSIGCQYLQFTPVVERRECVCDDGSNSKGILPFSVEPLQWGRFLCRLFDRWIDGGDVGRVFVQLFDATLANWVGKPCGVCSMSTLCGQSPALQPDGSLYSCDHFVFPDYLLGNLQSQTITEMVFSERQQYFGRQKLDGLSTRCRQCEYLFACHGECPRNRFLPDHENYLCDGYRMFFRHAAPDMEAMAAKIRVTSQE